MVIKNREKKFDSIVIGIGAMGSSTLYQLAKNNGYVPPKEYKLFYKVITDPYCFLRTL